MPAGSPTAGDLHVDQALTNMSLAFTQGADKFGADRIFPIVPVPHKSDTYHSFNRDDWFRDDVRRRAAGTESAGGGYETGTATYKCEKWSLHFDIDDDSRANADPAAPPERAVTQQLTMKALIRKDRLFAATYMAASIWTTDYAGVSGTPSGSQIKQWDVSGSTPIADVLLLKDLVEDITGQLPNVMVVGPAVHRALKDHADIKDAIKYTERASVTAAIIAALFEVEEYIVLRGVYATNAPGATAAYSRIVNKTFLLAFRNPAPAIMAPSAGYTFAWAGLYGANAAGGQIKNIRMEELESDRIEINMSFDQKLVSADLGAFVATAVG